MKKVQKKEECWKHEGATQETTSPGEKAKKVRSKPPHDDFTRQATKRQNCDFEKSEVTKKYSGVGLSLDVGTENKTRGRRKRKHLFHWGPLRRDLQGYIWKGLEEKKFQNHKIK